jgi:hypothetical protein
METFQSGASKALKKEYIDVQKVEQWQRHRKTNHEGVDPKIGLLFWNYDVQKGVMLLFHVRSKP